MGRLLRPCDVVSTGVSLSVMADSAALRLVDMVSKLCVVDVVEDVVWRLEEEEIEMKVPVSF